jgi:UDP-2,4-diacetamido-2,4,6-trideoxy-beta-L-altropyranose hydrolase
MSRAAEPLPAPQAVFRCDGSAGIGGGHLRRCLTLAEALQHHGWRCAFATTAASLAVLPRLADAVQILLLDEADSRTPRQEADAIARRYPRCDWLIVDHYGRDQAFERPCRSFAAHILVIDDLADRPHDGDVLLDQTPGRRAEDYRGLVPPGCQRLLGPAFGLLRPEFARGRAAALARPVPLRPPYHVLLAMGLTDPGNLTALALQALSACLLPLTVEVILGAAAPGLGAVRTIAAGMAHPVRLHVDPPRMAVVMAAADLIIGAAGTSSWERCCLGRPSIALVAAGNQQMIAAELAAAGAAHVFADGSATPAAALAAAVTGLLNDPQHRSVMAGAAARLCDGAGVQRVAAHLQQAVTAPRPAGLARAG